MGGVVWRYWVDGGGVTVCNDWGVDESVEAGSRLVCVSVVAV